MYNIYICIHTFAFGLYMYMCVYIGLANCFYWSGLLNHVIVCTRPGCFAEYGRMVWSIATIASNCLVLCLSWLLSVRITGF